MASMRRSCSSASGVAPSMPETLTIPGQAGAQHHFPHPEKHQNRILLPHHLHGLCLKEELKKWLNQLAADEMKDPARYHNSGMLFRLPNGLTVEPVLIRKKFLKWQDAHPEFPRIVFHGLRHSSATYQLMISGGDVKAVQGTTGHATADMLVNTYAHIQQSSRVELGKKFEEGFYAKSESPSPQAVPAAGEPTISMTALLELLKNAGPEVKAQLRLALLT